MKKFIFAILLIIAINFAFSSKCTDKKPATGAELKEADCKDLETSDKDKLQCVFNAVSKKCEEVTKVSLLKSKLGKLSKGAVVAAVAACVVTLVLCVLLLKCLF